MGDFYNLKTEKFNKFFEEINKLSKKIMLINPMENLSLFESQKNSNVYSSVNNSSFLREENSCINKFSEIFNSQNQSSNLFNDKNYLSLTQKNTLENEKQMKLFSQSSKAVSNKNVNSFNIDMSGMKNSISKEMDIDNFILKLTEKLEDALAVSALGVHI